MKPVAYLARLARGPRYPCWVQAGLVWLQLALVFYPLMAWAEVARPGLFLLAILAWLAVGTWAGPAYWRWPLQVLIFVVTLLALGVIPFSWEDILYRLSRYQRELHWAWVGLRLGRVLPVSPQMQTFFFLLALGLGTWIFGLLVRGRYALLAVLSGAVVLTLLEIAGFAPVRGYLVAYLWSGLLLMASSAAGRLGPAEGRLRPGLLWALLLAGAVVAASLAGPSLPALSFTWGPGEASGGPVMQAARIGYGDDDSRLGGGYVWDETLVMEVQADVASYWRGESRDFYTGTGWITTWDEASLGRYDSSAARRAPRTGAGPESQRYVLLGRDLFAAGKGQVLEQEVTRYLRLPVLFGAYRVQRVVTAGPPESPAVIIQSPEDKFIFRPTRTGGNGFKYSLVSILPQLDAEKLRRAGKQYPADISQRYLELPPALPERVVELAREITARAGNPYDKAEALARYLQVNFAYEDTDLRLPPPGRDFVDFFLFDLQKGYCDYFSTAMAVMARAVGLPSRWVKGFTPGEQSANGSFRVYNYNAHVGDECRSLLALTSFRVYNYNAHSWVEIYFPGYGWVPFEATPGYALPEVPAAGEAGEPNAATPDAGSSLELAGGESLPELLRARGWGLAQAGLLVGLGVVLGVAWWLQKENEKRRRQRDFPEEEFIRLAGRLFSRRQHAGQTPRELALAQKDPEDRVAWLQLVRMFEHVGYGGGKLEGGIGTWPSG